MLCGAGGRWGRLAQGKGARAPRTLQPAPRGTCLHRLAPLSPLRGLWHTGFPALCLIAFLEPPEKALHCAAWKVGLLEELL